MAIVHCSLHISQSNGRSSNVIINGSPVAFPGGWTSNSNIKIWYYYAQALQTYVPGTNSDWNSPVAWGPEAEFARLWVQDVGKVHMWKQAVDGTPMYPDASPSVPNWAIENTPKNQWMNLIEQTKAMQAAIIAAGDTPQLDVMTIFQGETDANNSRGAEYAYRLLRFINYTRQILNAPDMKVVITRILPYWNQDGGLVRQAQKWIGSLPGNTWIDIDDLGNGDAAHSHISAADAVVVGARQYAAYQSL